MLVQTHEKAPFRNHLTFTMPFLLSYYCEQALFGKSPKVGWPAKTSSTKVWHKPSEVKKKE